MSTQLDIAAITCRYGQRDVCKDLSFTVAAGEIACLLGHSGCGKTTVLRAIAGFEPVYSGSITLAGHELCNSHHSVPPEQRQVGMVFQDYALFPHLTVAGNVAFGLSRFSAVERQQLTTRLLELTRLQDYANSWPHQLSGGQQQRVALARALAPQPKLLLMDEPFSNLDTELRRTLCHEVRALLKSQGTTAILVTHDQSEAFTTADSIGVMSAGRILQWGSARELYETPNSPEVARFIGQGLLLNASSDGHQLHTPFGTLPLNVGDCLAPGPIELLVRPWNIEHQPSSPVRARIVTHSFQGAFTLTTLELSDGTRIQSQDDGFAGLNPGSDTGIGFNTRHLRYFPQQTAR